MALNEASCDYLSPAPSSGAFLLHRRLRLAPSFLWNSPSLLTFPPRWRRQGESAFAADTPDPNAKGEPSIPSGSNEGNPTAPKSADTTVDKSDNSTPVTTPGEESKGKPKIAPQ